MSQPVDVNFDNFEQEVLNADQPVVIDFWAAWCGPCRQIGPVLADLARKYDGKVKVAKINVDQERAIAGHFQVQGIPALFVVHNRTVVDSMVGFGGRGPLEKLFERHATRAA